MSPHFSSSPSIDFTSKEYSFASSIAFDGTLLYVIEGGNKIKSYSPGIPSEELLVLSQSGLTCVGIARENDETVLYYGVEAGATLPTDPPSNGTNATVVSSPKPSMWRASLDGENRVKVADFDSGSCVYVIQQVPLVIWSSSDGQIYQWNSSAPVAEASVVQSAAPGNCTGAITTVSTANLFLFASGNEEVRSNQLDELLKTQPGPPVDRLWHSFPGNSTNGMITLNGALVVSTDVGVWFFFPPFSTTSSSQGAARLLLEGTSTVRGMATDSGLALTVSLTLTVLLVVLSILM